ncbi:HD-GYP domain-containing protein [Roseomonas sp. KE0001]|uniref:HD-GYP domain-containing protein n=2 Tax=unclassified Roseomonas TaxID=2617492 RepID=UPI0018DFB643|nr:HD domain-containing phosphohydrolase [Roseomonas sp. KE0001]MBI0432662.1 HD domain-containing protein [Roseomonas sp. KE0001]
MAVMSTATHPPLSEDLRELPPDPNLPDDLSRQSLRLLAALRRHHPPTADHSIRVATVLLAMWSRRSEALGDAALIVAAGLLHDLGKLFLPVSLLDAARQLTPLETAAVREHPRTGSETLSALGYPEAVVFSARDHHERWQGGGYPSGRQGRELMPLVRAVCVADAFVAMIEPGRAYRRHLTVAEALLEVQACSGTQFDPGFAALLVDGLGPTFQAELGLDTVPGERRAVVAGLLPSHLLQRALRLPPCPW